MAFLQELDQACCHRLSVACSVAWGQVASFSGVASVPWSSSLPESEAAAQGVLGPKASNQLLRERLVPLLAVASPPRFSQPAALRGLLPTLRTAP